MAKASSEPFEFSNFSLQNYQQDLNKDNNQTNNRKNDLIQLSTISTSIQKLISKHYIYSNPILIFFI